MMKDHQKNQMQGVGMKTLCNEGRVSRKRDIAAMIKWQHSRRISELELPQRHRIADIRVIAVAARNDTGPLAKFEEDAISEMLGCYEKTMSRYGRERVAEHDVETMKQASAQRSYTNRCQQRGRQMPAPLREGRRP